MRAEDCCERVCEQMWNNEDVHLPQERVVDEEVERHGGLRDDQAQCQPEVTLEVAQAVPDFAFISRSHPTAEQAAVAVEDAGGDAAASWPEPAGRVPSGGASHG
jgi:hypothetical protein